MGLAPEGKHTTPNNLMQNAFTLSSDTIILSNEEKKRGTFMVRLLSLVAFPSL